MKAYQVYSRCMRMLFNMLAYRQPITYTLWNKKRLRGWINTQIVFVKFSYLAFQFSQVLYHFGNSWSKIIYFAAEWFVEGVDILRGRSMCRLCTIYNLDTEKVTDFAYLRAISNILNKGRSLFFPNIWFTFSLLQRASIIFDQSFVFVFDKSWSGIL